MRKKEHIKLIKQDVKRNWPFYAMMIPIIIFYILFNYKPLYGTLIAFQDYKPAKGFGVDWVGLKHFQRFITNPFFGRLLRNTATISVMNLLISFPGAIALALMLNEVKNEKFKTIAQSCMHLPYFISLVVICGIIRQFSMSDGLFNDIIALFGGERTSLLQQQGLYKWIYVLSDVWKNVGWDSIIFMAALSNVDTQLYDAASVDGAGKWKQMLHVTLPGITPTIITMLIIRVGYLFSLGYEKTLLLYNESIYETADIISTYVYRYGMQKQQWSYSTAVDLFNAAINITLVLGTNKLSKKLTETSLW